LFDGALQALHALREAGFLLAVATGKSRRGLDRALEATGLQTLFHATRCADESFSKPHPGMLLWLLDELDVGRERTLMIGDTSHDMEMALAAEVPRLAVAYGAHPRENLLKHDPLACLNTFHELSQWLTARA
jgi:phosphoglycolate phosphatase